MDAVLITEYKKPIINDRNLRSYKYVWARVPVMHRLGKTSYLLQVSKMFIAGNSRIVFLDTGNKYYCFFSFETIVISWFI